MSITTTKQEKGAIRAHLERIGAQRVLEIGAFHGETTRVLHEVVDRRGGYVAVIDPMTWSSEVLRNGVMRHFSRPFPRLMAALEVAAGAMSYEKRFWNTVGRQTNVHLFRGLSTDAKLLGSGDPHLHDLDAVFIDGDHSYHGALHDLTHWASRVVPGGLVLLHDVNRRFPGVERAFTDWWTPERMESGVQVGSLCVVRMIEPPPAVYDVPRPSVELVHSAE